MRWFDIEQRSPEWFKLRLGIPTASNFHRIITPKTLKPSESRNKYRNQLIAEWWTGIPLEDFQSKSMEAGIENEDRARRAYENITDIETTRPGFFTALDGMVGASPDGLADPSIDVEIKCRELHTQIGWFLRNDEKEILEHRIQCQGRLWIEERDWSHLWNFNDRMVIPLIKLPRDEKCITAIDEALRQFVEELLVGREKVVREFGPPQVPEPPPAPDAMRDMPTDEDVSRLYDLGAIKPQNEQQ